MKKLKVILLSILIIAVAGLFAIILFSPYGYKDNGSLKMVKHTVVIDASPEQVFTYLGNSDNAKVWSVFVDHISPLNSQEVPDGKPGSRRRCFCNADETGRTWDELITVVEPNKKRQLAMYNYRNFSVTAENLATEQLYQELPGNKTKLSFTVFIKSEQQPILDQLKFYYAAYEMQDIF